MWSTIRLSGEAYTGVAIGGLGGGGIDSSGIQSRGIDSRGIDSGASRQMRGPLAVVDGPDAALRMLGVLK